MVELPPYIDPEAWQGFVEMRLAKGKRTPFTPRAAKMILKTLEQLKEAGHDANASLDQSTLAGWSDVYEPKQKSIRRAAQSGETAAQRWLAEHPVASGMPPQDEAAKEATRKRLAEARQSVLKRVA